MIFHQHSTPLPLPITEFRTKFSLTVRIKRSFDYTGHAKLQEFTKCFSEL